MKDQEEPAAVLHLFTLHYPGLSRFKSFRVARSLEEAVAAWGGEFVPRPGGICTCSSDVDELGTCGVLRFGPQLFREMDTTDQALAGCLPGDVVYTEGGLGLLAWRGQTVELVVRQHSLLYDPSVVTLSRAA